IGPLITDFSPGNGPPETIVVINGANFSDATAVQFNGTNAAFFITSGSQIHATVPAKATSGPLTVISPGGTGVSANAFIVTGLGPRITDFSPVIGQPGTLVVINGVNFSGITAVLFNGTNASFTITAATQIQAKVPVGATNGPISLVA